VRVIIESDADAVAECASGFFQSLLLHKPDVVLGLATGSTPIKLYQKLIQKFQQGLLNFQQATTFNLDEYVGLEIGHPESYRCFMQEQLFRHINVRPEATHLPQVESKNLLRQGADYDEKILAAGGIDLQLLGIGSDGHIGFNEPGSSLASRTRIKALTRVTRQDNARFFNSIDDVPKLSVTMGIGSILKARRCMLLATGPAKAKAIQAMIEGSVTARVPASALQLHPDTIVILDPDAAKLLQFKDYYQDSELLQRELESTTAET